MMRERGVGMLILALGEFATLEPIECIIGAVASSRGFCGCIARKQIK